MIETVGVTVFSGNVFRQKRAADSQYTQNNNAEHDVIQTENLTAVDNEIAQAGVGRQKFADNDADEAETYIDFQVTDDGRDAGRKNNIAKNISACATKGPDEQ